jgi:hypothetical protein
MKEQRVISFDVQDHQAVASLLNELIKEGWYVKQVYTGNSLTFTEGIAILEKSRNKYKTTIRQMTKQELDDRASGKIQVKGSRRKPLTK